MSLHGNPATPPVGGTIYQLDIKSVFDALNQKDKFYAHHLARAAWHASRIVLRQVSTEGPDIFDFIMDLYHACDGKWSSLVAQCSITEDELASFLEYAATFLCNLGNFYGEGDMKFVPAVSKLVVQRLAGISTKTSSRLDTIIKPLFAVPPFSLGYPSKSAQSGYYPGDEPMTPDDVEKVSLIMERMPIGPENTRVRKVIRDGRVVFEIMQASVETERIGHEHREIADGVFLIRGDHSVELAKICSALQEAKAYTANAKQALILSHYIECFQTGSLEAFQESQKLWVTDVSARVEQILGFIEPYRDPAGIRSEWEGVVGIADQGEIDRLKEFVNTSTTFIQQLPWAVADINDGKGPFEKSLFEAPDFTSLHVCSSVVFEAANLPNYEYIRETCGFKNIVLANRLNVNNNPLLTCYWVDASEIDFFRSTTHRVRFLTTAIHELIGHGTGKLLSETSPGSYNFDKHNPPISPLDGKAIRSYYLPGQTWGSIFGKLAGTVEECRAILMSEYLMDNKSLLGIFEYNDTSDITADELLYATYLNIGVDGLQALEHYNKEDQAWGQVHHQAHFAILKYLLKNGQNVVSIAHDAIEQSLVVKVNRDKILYYGKPTLGHFLCQLHIWRCTADVSACRDLYEPMCAVDGIYEEWRKIVKAKPKMKWKFVQPNTFIVGDNVEVKIYDETNEGIIQSWAERDV